jgi:DNA polymerase III subunit gamma/tau
MAYEALARKWRPKTFEEVVGQGHVTRALANALSLGRIHHAYMFSGTRGVGKTTFARILARTLNCGEGPTASPCLSCAACREVLEGASVDVQEIDGASNTGIDDIRRLRENAAYAPARLRYKVYIIDEVHMLSKAAFNGLLKILEEPPPHVVFVFATTEPARVPDTILSRVQRFDFRMLTEEEILARLEEIAGVEGIRHEEDALRLVARYAFGSMRDGLSLFEQASVSGGGMITAELVEGMLGLVGTEAAIDLVQAVVEGGAEAALEAFTGLLRRGADLKFLYLSVVDVLRDAAVLAFTGKDDLLARHAPSSLARMRLLCGRKSRGEWLLLLDIAFRSEKDVLGTEFQRLGFELLLLRLVNAPELLSLEAYEAGETATESPERPGPSYARSQASAAPDGHARRTRTTVERHPHADPRSGSTADPGDPAKAGVSRPRADTGDTPGPVAKADSSRRSGGRVRDEDGVARTGGGAPAGRGEDAKADLDIWDALVRNLGEKKRFLMGLLSQMRGWRDGDVLVISCPYEKLFDRLREPDTWPVLLQAIEEIAGKRLEVAFRAGPEKKTPESDPGERDGGDLERKALEDPLLVEVMKEFDGAAILSVRPAPARPEVMAAEGIEEAAEEEPDTGAGGENGVDD